MRYEHTTGKINETLDFLAEHCRTQLEGLSPETKERLDDVAHGQIISPWQSKRFANTLHGPTLWKCVPTEKERKEAIANIAFLTELLASQSLPQTIAARRAVNVCHFGIDWPDLDPYRKGAKDPKGLVGMIYRERGFPFFSALLDDCEAYSDRGVYIYSDLPKGLEAMYIDPLRRGNVRKGIGEIIVQRGLSWRIVKAWREGGQLKLKAMPMLGSDTPWRLEKDLADFA